MLEIIGLMIGVYTMARMVQSVFTWENKDLVLGLPVWARWVVVSGVAAVALFVLFALTVLLILQPSQPNTPQH